MLLYNYFAFKILQNESHVRVKLWRNGRYSISCSWKEILCRTLNTCSLPWALEVTSGTDTGKGTSFMILINTEASIPLLWLSFKLLLEVLWHLSFCKSEKIKLLLSSTICLRCIAMYLSERDGVSWKYDLFVPLILESSLADTCCIWALSNVVETEPQNTQQKHMLFQMKQHGPFQERNSAPLLVPCVVCEGFTEAERSRTPIAFLSKRPHHLLIHSDFPFLSDAYDNPPTSPYACKEAQKCSAIPREYITIF